MFSSASVKNGASTKCAFDNFFLKFGLEALFCYKKLISRVSEKKPADP